jgi:hypothetical protein
VARQHRNQHALTDTRAREYSETLPFTNRQERVDCAEAGIQRLLDHATPQRIGSQIAGVKFLRSRILRDTLIIEGATQSINNAPEQRSTDRERGALRKLSVPITVGIQVCRRDDQRTRHQTPDRIERHQISDVIAKPNALSVDPAHSLWALHTTSRSNLLADPLYFQEQTRDTT